MVDRLSIHVASLSTSTSLSHSTAIVIFSQMFFSYTQSEGTPTHSLMDDMQYVNMPARMWSGTRNSDEKTVFDHRLAISIGHTMRQIRKVPGNRESHVCLCPPASTIIH